MQLAGSTGLSYSRDSLYREKPPFGPMSSPHRTHEKATNGAESKDAETPRSEESKKTLLSKELKDSLWKSVSLTMSKYVQETRNVDEKYDAIEKPPVRIAACVGLELLAIAAIPVAVIEGVVKLALEIICSIAHNLGFMNKDNAYYENFRSGSKISVLAGFIAWDTALKNLNWRQGTKIKINLTKDHSFASRALGFQKIRLETASPAEKGQIFQQQIRQGTMQDMPQGQMQDMQAALMQAYDAGYDAGSE